MRRKAATLAVLAAVATGCGGHGTTHPAAHVAVDGSTAGGAGAAVNAGATTAPSFTPAGGGIATTGGKPAAHGSAAPSGASTPTPTGPASHREVPLNATLAAPCVTPGGSQTLTIHGDPGWRVVFDTRYPDGKDGQVYGGIDYRGSISSAGSYVYTWMVSPAAPVGDADVEAGAVGQDVTAHARLPFKIALHCS